MFEIAPPGLSVGEDDLQSEHRSGASSFQILEGSVSPLDASPATPRRRWSAAAKERIVMEALAPGANVSAIARAHGLSPQQIFTWRRQAVAQAASRKGDAEKPSFAVVAVAAPEAGGMVEVVLEGMTLRIGPTVPAARVQEILRAVWAR